MTKAQRINRVKNTLYSEDELYRRLGELSFIEDDELRSSVVRTFMDGCPDYFWSRPTSSSGKYHPHDECGEFGNLIHTKRVFAEYENISRSYVEAEIITEYERECGMAAALIHDMLKYGWPSEQNDHTVSNHDLIGGDVARHIGETPELVARLVEVHNGPWADGPEPESQHEWLFHTADMSAAGVREDRRAIHDAADEVLEEWPELCIIEDE